MGDEDGFCGFCGAHRDANIGSSSAARTVSTDEAWREALYPGEEVLFIARRAVVGYIAQTGPFSDNTSSRSFLWPRKEYRVVGPIVLTGQRLLCFNKGKILVLNHWVTQGLRKHRVQRQAGFTVDPALAKEWTEVENRARAERVAAFRGLQTRGPEARDSRRILDGVLDRQRSDGLAATLGGRLRPMVWVWPKEHRLRPRPRWFRVSVHSIGCLLLPFLILTSPFLAVANLVYLPFRLRRWTGIRLNDDRAFSTPPTRFFGLEIGIFDRQTANQLLEMLQFKAASIRQILQQQGCPLTLAGQISRPFHELRETLRKER